jgi:hypothetical protein
MARTNEEIYQLYRDREMRRTPTTRRCREVRDSYHGDYIIPMPELDESSRPTVANLISLGIDQTARRIASTMPDPMFLPDSDTEAARDRARARKTILKMWWDEEALRQKTMRLARHFCAYSEAVLTLMPSAYDRACWRVRDPLDSYPADTEQEMPTVTDCIFTSSRTYGWVRTMYPEVPLPSRALIRDEQTCTLLEYLDANERVVIVTWNEAAANQSYTVGGGYSAAGDPRFARIARTPLDLDYSPICVARRPGLARPSGQMDGVIGSYLAMALLQSLEMVAVKKSVFNDEWMIARDGQTPVIIEPADGLRGVTGKATNATPWVNTSQPGFMAPQAIDRYERDIRTTAVIPAEFGGESASNVRTGRRGDAILSAAIDFVVQEAQESFAPMLHCADLSAIDYDRKWYDKPKVYYLRKGATQIEKTYQPSKLWSSDRHIVAYAYAGSDANSLIIGLGQRLGLETMSRYTAMATDPLIDDPEMEHDLIIAESLERALLAGLSAQAQQGALPPHDLARIQSLVVSDAMELPDAVAKVQEEAQARQAQQVPPQDPAAQPGIAQPGAGAEAAVAAPQPGQRNLRQLLSQLGMARGQMAQANAAQ